MIIHLVCGARPNFMKIAPLYHRLCKESWAKPVVVHTGQHYDNNMSDAFFSDLGLPRPDVYLGVGSGNHGEQTARVLMEYERVLMLSPPDLVVVVGDVNSTVAATLAATKLGIRVAHLEAGLRSFDRRMPEEINRLVTDVIADELWTPSADGVENLIREGIPKEKIKLVGNIMIDCFEMLRENIEAQNAHEAFGLEKGAYGVVTLHRPSNVDDAAALSRICVTLEHIAGQSPLVFPVHPRTRKKMDDSGLLPRGQTESRLLLPDPMNYVRFMSLVLNARLVITDSGGIQEETSYLGIPCLTVRENTERPVTITHGTNQLCSLDSLAAKADELLRSRRPGRRRIEFWDGKTADRIVALLRESRPAIH